jgi:hypothetical protein
VELADRASLESVLKRLSNLKYNHQIVFGKEKESHAAEDEPKEAEEAKVSEEPHVVEELKEVEEEERLPKKQKVDEVYIESDDDDFLKF